MLPSDEGRTATAVSPSGPDPPLGDLDFRLARKLNSQADMVATAPDLQALTRAVRHGDADAFSRLYDLYSFRLYKFLLVLAHGDEHEAREVCQGVFIKLAKRCDVFDDERRLWAWLCVLAKNSFLDHRRAHQRRNRFISLGELSAEPAGLVNPNLRLNEILREALDALPPDERELIQAAYLDKRPLSELAAEAGQTYKAVESRLARLRQKLKERLLKALRHENES
jgi:RNA polymerase sigma-70 factor, ECF subfamily